MEKCYTVFEISKILSVRERVVLNLIESARLKAIDISRGDKPVWRIHDTSFLQFITEEYEKQKNRPYKKEKKITIFDICEIDKENIKNYILSNIEKNFQDCWNWKLTLQQDGYGTTGIEINGKIIHTSTHRLSYFIWKGEFKDYILHKCHNRACCNPDHLYEGDAKRNARDRMERSKGVNHLKISPESLQNNGE